MWSEAKKLNKQLSNMDINKGIVVYGPTLDGRMM
jgi:hypothetical protein